MRRIMPLHRLAALGIAGFALHSAPAQALEFDLPTNGDTVVGSPSVVIPTPENSLYDLARYYDTGILDIKLANPGVHPWVPGKNQRIIIPTQYILPKGPWQGVVVNVAQRRLFYFPPAREGEPRKVITFPVGVAKEGWSTPLGSTRVTSKLRDPGWSVPRSIKAEKEAENGLPFPDYVPPGPDNPMGMLAIGTGFPSIFIHATNKPWGVGMRQSHGCIQLYPENAKLLFDTLPKNTPVRIVHEPVVVGRLNGEVVMAAYPALDEYRQQEPSLDQLKDTIRALTPAGKPAPKAAAVNLDRLDWLRAQSVLDSHSSLPVSLDPDTPMPGEQLSRVRAQPYDRPPYGSDANNATPVGKPDVSSGDDDAPA